MALIECPECNEEISDAAYDCPKCGATLKKPTRSFFGKIIKWMFILFNIFMIVWVIGAFNIGGEAVSDASSDAAAAGAAIGSAIGVGFIALIWVFGDIILGMVFLFTRPSKN